MKNRPIRKNKTTRKLCYRKDDRAMPKKFSGLPDYAHDQFSRNFSWRFVSFVPIDPCVQNLKSVAFSLPQIIGVPKNWAAHATP